MTNKISSAEQAIDALIKLKSKHSLVRVEFAVPYALFSFEGYISEVNFLSVSVEGTPVAGSDGPKLVLSALESSTFDGEIREEESRLFVRLLISRPLFDKPADVFRFVITGEWCKEDLHTSRPN